jgi:hypothetical protein
MTVLVTACGRSGTLYTASVFRALAMRTSHEQIFTPDRREPPSTFGPFEGASSWLAAPFLGALPPDTFVFHQTRDPAEVIASLLGIHFFRPLRPVPVGTMVADVVELIRRGAARGTRRPIRIDYIRFIRWADTEVLRGDELERCVRYWVRWNRLIEERAPADRYVRYRLEDLDAAALTSYLHRGGVDRSLAEVERAIRSVPTSTNARVRDRAAAERIRRHPAHAALSEAAARYGYVLDG